MHSSRGALLAHWSLQLLLVSVSWAGLGWAEAAAATGPDGKPLKAVRVLFLTDCTRYSNWQAVGDIFSFKMSGQPGRMNRVMCCTPEEQKKFDQDMLKEMDTWIAPSFTVHPRTGDVYLAYNKPEAVVDWTAHNKPEEEYVLVLDSDMLLRHPFLVEDMKPSPGWSSAASFGYMIGVNNELAERHIPEIPKRNDTYAGPFGRRADQVGGFFFTEYNDLKRMAPGWLKYTEDVRADPEAYHLTGDVYAVKPGMKAWISEMYGYAFGAATAGLWHKWDTISMLYPGYEPIGIPKLMHYGLLFEIPDPSYKFDKHWHYDFDVTICPPWDLSSKDDKKASKAGIFPIPPRPSALKSKGVPGQHMRDLLSIETVITLNAAFCDYHLKHCPPSHQLLEVCTEVMSVYLETEEAMKTVEPHFKCRNFQSKCDQWAKDKECVKNYSYMRVNCPMSCGQCHSISENMERNKPTETMAMLEKLKQTLSAAKAVGHEDIKAQAGSDPDTAKVVKSPPVAVATIKPVETPATPSQQPAASPHPSPVPAPDHKAVETKHVIPDDAPTVSTGAPNADDTPSEVLKEDAADSRSSSKLRRGGVDGSIKKELLIRCYRMTQLTPQQVKDCAAAASRGEKWTKPDSEGAVAKEADKGTGDAGVDTAQADEEDQEAAAKRKRRRRQQREDGKVAHHDLGELHNLHYADNENDAAAEGGEGVVRRKARITTMAGMTTTQALIVWVVVLVALLFLVPRVLRRMRRKHRYGIRSD